MLESSVPAGVRGDPMRLRQVLINLAGNAIKFTEGGEVAVRVKALDEEGRLRFEVTDTGIGISEEAQTQIFSAFSQADSFTTRKYGGTGLGLAICRQLVSLMGGEIGVHSAPNRGSTFWFEVRLTPTADPAATFTAMSSLLAGATQAVVPGSGPLILLVEDNAVNREVAVGMLENLGYRTETAANGMLAMEAVSEGSYAAVLMDCQMPVMDGLRRRPRYGAARRSRAPHGCRSSRSPRTRWKATASAASPPAWMISSPSRSLSSKLAQLLGRWLPAVREQPEPARAASKNPAGPRSSTWASCAISPRSAGRRSSVRSSSSICSTRPG